MIIIYENIVTQTSVTNKKRNYDHNDTLDLFHEAS